MSIENVKKKLEEASKSLSTELKEVSTAESRGYVRGYVAAQLDMQESLPRPCNGPLYDSWGREDFVYKLNEEVGEANKAIGKYARCCNEEGDDAIETEKLYDDAMLELTDVITVATSLMESMGCDLEERMVYQRRVNESNAKRDGGRRFK